MFDSSNGDDPAADSLPYGVMLIQGLRGSGNKKTYQVGKDITGLYFEIQTSFVCGKAFGLKTDILLTHLKFTPGDTKGKNKYETEYS